MATTRSFSAMLNEYLPNELLTEELVKRDYVLKTVERDDSWLGGDLIVPFEGACASSVAFGSLTASTDIAEDIFVRGAVSAYKEVWGTMIFNHTDLMQHGAISEQNLVKLLPGRVDRFIDNMKNLVSTNLLNGAHLATLTSDGGATGELVVDHPERFAIGQKVFVIDGNTAISSAGYVRTINMNTSTLVVYDARSGGSTINYSAYTTAQAAKVYGDGAATNSFSSIKSALLSAANGGDATLYGQTKTAYPYLQAINVDGSSVTKTNIMAKIFEALVTIRKIGKGNPTDILMSYTNMGYCMSVIEASKGAFNVMPGSQKASQYGWMEITVGSVTNSMLKLVGIQECDDDAIMYIDWRAIKFYTNGFFKKRKSPDGREYFEVRATTGYSYIVDICCFGELVVERPSYCGILYGISIT